MAYKCVSKNGGDKDKKGPNVSCERDKPKEEKDRKKLRQKDKYEGNYLKTVEVYKNKSERGGPTSVEAGNKTVVSNSIKAEEDERKGVPKGSQGITFSGDTKDYSGEDKTISLKSKDEGADKEAIVKETKFYKRKGAIGRALGKDYRQKGGIIETENDGNVTTITYKGKGRKARVKEEKDKKIEETYKDRYDTAKADIKADESGLFKNPWQLTQKQKALAELPYSRSKVKETKSDTGEVKSYTLGTPYASDKEIRISKDTAKDYLNKSKEGTVKMKKRILKKALKKGEYGKS
jgi:hypothetical protein